MKTIGRYQIEAEIGRGAMGVVYRATDPELRRTVAIKTYAVPAGLNAEMQEEFRRRFQREAQAAAGLSHPGIVTIFDAGEDPETGQPFIAMEYVPGKSLADLLESENTFPLERVTAIAATLGGALATAHAAGIVHRDIKPANILVHEHDGSVKIADFGVAHVQASTLTHSGAALGSPAYMSPEQIRGKDLDGRSDLFSLAAILYELLCKSRPFEGKEIAEVLYAVAHETPVPMCRRNPSLPAGLEAFFDRALAKSAEDRFPDGDTLAREFASAASASTAASGVDVKATVRELPAVARPRRRTQALFLAVALIAAVSLAWIGLHKEEAHLMLEGKSRVDGDLKLLVDGQEVYGRALRAPRAAGEPGFLRKVSERIKGPDYETFQALIDVAAGKRTIEVVVTSDGEPYRSTLTANLSPGETRELKLVAGRSRGSSVSLRLD